MNILSVVSCSLVLSCTSQVKIDNKFVSNDTVKVEKIEIVDTVPKYLEFDRTVIKSKLKAKIDSGKPLFVHVLVPLCDNVNQGIVPTTKSLGNGFSLRTNLYWATSHGMKRYFKELDDWELLQSEKFHPDSVVLERVVFKKKFANGTKVVLIADAYRGDKIKNCLVDFFNSLSGELNDTLFLESDTILMHSNADLVAYNGHNGLMDVWVDETLNKDGIQKDAVVIACSSMYDFNERLKHLKGYPLVMTTNLLYPGAFVLEGVINSWALQKSEELIRQSAGDEYHRVKKCGVKGARNLFSTGW